jgi:surface polysaccharide O-acyltransferase-like enzyme
MSQTSLALSNLRAIIILLVVAVHAFLAYLGSAATSAFDKPPFLWRAIPIADQHRWFGFDIFCAWQDIYLMVLLFFLSALFTWPSLARKGTDEFLGGRFLRLGIPYLFGALVLMPVSLYPAYRTTAADPGLSAYVHHLLALPFWDNGPMWFLWQLLVLTILAAALHRFAPRWIESLGRASADARVRPGVYFLWLTVAAVLAYVPLALAFTPMAWAERGPLSIQFCRPLLYLVFYVAGLGVGAQGFDRSLLAADSALARGWARWLVVASISFASWLGLMGYSVMTHSASLALQTAIDIAFAVAAASGCFAALAISLRFVRTYSRILDGLSKNALGLYVVHYPFCVWLQFALLGVALFAFAKAMIVFGLSLLFSLALVVVLRRLPFGSLLLGEAPLLPAPFREFHGADRKPSAAVPLARRIP